MGSTLQADQSLEELSRSPGAEQHSSQHRVDEVLHLVHALCALVEAVSDGFIALCADGLVRVQTRRCY